MENRKPILALTDLSQRSDPAMELAGSLAHHLSADLHVLHAMSLTYRPLRSVVVTLSHGNGAIGIADELIRAQLRRVVPPSVFVHEPIIDVDDSTRAVQRRAQQIDPWVVITPPIWDWATKQLRQRTNFRAAFAHVQAPVLIIKESRRRPCGTVTVLSHSDTLDAESVESAARWAFWLDLVYGSPVQGGPHFDLMLLDDEVPRRSLTARLTDVRCDLIAIDPTMLLRDDVEKILDFVMPIILKQTEIPVALLKADFTGGGGHAINNADRFAAAEGSRESSLESDGIAAGSRS